MKPKHTFLYYMSVFTIALGFFIVGLFGYWMLYPYNILEFGEGNGTLLTKEVKSGGYLQMRQVYCKHKPLSSKIDRQFIDGIAYKVPTIYNDRNIGCYDKIEYIYIPKALPPLEGYHIDTAITFQVNPIREVTYTVETNTFTIKE